MSSNQRLSAFKQRLSATSTPEDPKGISDGSRSKLSNRYTYSSTKQKFKSLNLEIEIESSTVQEQRTTGQPLTAGNGSLPVLEQKQNDASNADLRGS